MCRYSYAKNVKTLAAMISVSFIQVSSMSIPIIVSKIGIRADECREKSKIYVN